VVGISQSGQSPDVVSVVEEARKQGRPTIAFTNDLNSPLARMSDQAFDLCKTPEHAIAATKTYTTQLAAVALLGAALGGDQAHVDELHRLPEAMEKVLAGAGEPCAAAAAQLRDETSFLTIARGINLCTAEELALKLRELLRVTTQGFSAADFRHGSIALIVPGTPALLIAPSGIAAEDMNALATEVTARGAKLAVIAESPQAVPGAQIAIPLAASVPEWLSPLTAVLPGQRLALELVLAKGLDPDRPRGLPEKVVRTT
jgi:glucosamine--fructose-6-phosphate aminotransferase (isomerizing)